MIDYTTLYYVGAENEDASMDQEETSYQDEAINLAALWGKLRHWAGWVLMGSVSPVHTRL